MKRLRNEPNLIPLPPDLPFAGAPDPDDRWPGGWPPGWSYSPSSARQRVAVVLAAFAGLAVTAYLGLLRRGAALPAWEPLFRAGPHPGRWAAAMEGVPGVVLWLALAVTSISGGGRRWKTLPWMVLLSGAAAVLLALCGTLTAALEAVRQSGCTLCLAAAAAAVLVTGPVLAEVLATLQSIRRQRRRRVPLWRALLGLPPRRR
jgi:hypothetical protein